MKILDLFQDQKIFSDLIGINRDMSNFERDKMTRDLSLALHTEVSHLVSATSYRPHTDEKPDPDPDKILFESVDVIRYAIAILNLWGQTPESFENAWSLKDRYLTSFREADRNKWQGEKVAIVDIDDVLCEFRQSFSSWLRRAYDIKADVDSSEYYFINALKEGGVNPEGVFERFISEGELANIDPVDGAVDFIKSLKSAGYFVHLLTARPKENLRCLYDTHVWLRENGIEFDKLDFASEKLRWCMQSDYWVLGSIEFAVDDSPKHALEYAKHGVKVLLPNKPYNREAQSSESVCVYTALREILDKINL